MIDDEIKYNKMSRDKMGSCSLSDMSVKIQGTKRSGHTTYIHSRANSSSIVMLYRDDLYKQYSNWNEQWENVDLSDRLTHIKSIRYLSYKNFSKYDTIYIDSANMYDDNKLNDLYNMIIVSNKNITFVLLD